MLIYIVHIVN